MKKFLITEEEKNRIRNLYIEDINNQPTVDYNSEESKIYFDTRVEQIMEYPEKFSEISGYDEKIVNAVSEGINEAITGLGRETEDLSYLISKGFLTLANSLAISKKYKESYGESLLEALKGEWFSGGLVDNVKNKISSSLKQWCSDKKNQKNTLCIVKNAQELKYGI